MKNIPRIFVEPAPHSGAIIPVEKPVAHYLGHVMRTKKCLVFGGGNEFFAELNDDGRTITVGDKTDHIDPGNNLTLYFAPIKKTDDLLNMATQMGVARFVPVITERVVAHHIKWDRMKKIVIEAAEQSNRNSVPEIAAPVNFHDLDLKKICFADERMAYEQRAGNQNFENIDSVLIGPEGGFSDSEFMALDNAGARPMYLCKTILRAEVAAVVAIGKLIT